LVEALLDVDDRADEVGTDLFVASSADDVIPQLPALPLSPAISALIDRDDALRRLLEKREHLRFDCLHETGSLSGHVPPGSIIVTA
jgi:hypothetical protein